MFALNYRRQSTAVAAIRGAFFNTRIFVVTKQSRGHAELDVFWALHLAQHRTHAAKTHTVGSAVPHLVVLDA